MMSPACCVNESTLRRPYSFSWGPQDELDLDACRASLFQHGLLLIHGRTPDHGARRMLAVVGALGRPHLHDGPGTMVWDIRCDGHTAARSHGSAAFPLHTDCSFEEPPPRFFALSVLRADRRGGGRTLLLNGRLLARHLSRPTLQTLLIEPYPIRVPDEFHKGTPAILGRLMTESCHFRYRRDLLCLGNCSRRQLYALAELEHRLADVELLQSMMLGDGDLLIVDNRRFLHGRTEVLDRERHLQRVWFS